MGGFFLPAQKKKEVTYGLIEAEEESQLAKISRDSSKITVEQLHGLMSQVRSLFAIVWRQEIHTWKIRDYVPIFEQLQALKKFIVQGKVRYVGIPNETSWGVMEFIRLSEEMDLPKIVSIQNNYSLLICIKSEVDLVEVCLPQNCNVDYSPLAEGALFGKYLDVEQLVTGRLNLF